MPFSSAFKAQCQGSSREPSLVGPTLTESASSPPSRFHQRLTILSLLPPAVRTCPLLLFYPPRSWPGSVWLISSKASVRLWLKHPSPSRAISYLDSLCSDSSWQGVGTQETSVGYRNKCLVTQSHMSGP